MVLFLAVAVVDVVLAKAAFYVVVLAAAAVVNVVEAVFVDKVAVCVTNNEVAAVVESAVAIVVVAFEAAAAVEVDFDVVVQLEFIMNQSEEICFSSRRLSQLLHLQKIAFLGLSFSSFSSLLDLICF